MVLCERALRIIPLRRLGCIPSLFAILLKGMSVGLSYGRKYGYLSRFFDFDTRGLMALPHLARVEIHPVDLPNKV